ncbi:MAG: gluconate 2-dehydrogenase subunit 3 family protein [Desulfobacterales bacterium]
MKDSTMSDLIESIRWSADEKTLLNGLLDEIIPASDDGRVPSAGSLGVADFIATKAREVPGLKDLLKRGLRTAKALLEPEGDTFEALSPADKLALAKNLERRESDFFVVLTKYTYMGYYTDPTVPPHLGLSAKPPHPYGYEVPDESPEELNALVEPVKKLGRCYREC